MQVPVWVTALSVWHCCYSPIMHSLHRHLLSTSVCQALCWVLEIWRTVVFVFQVLTALVLHFPAMLWWWWFPYPDVLLGVTPLHQAFCPFFPLASGELLSFFQNSSQISPSVEISLSLTIIIQLCITWEKKNLLEDRARAALGNLSQGIQRCISSKCQLFVASVSLCLITLFNTPGLVLEMDER